MPDQILTDIQEKLTHQEQQIHDLSDMIIHQSKDILTLKNHVLKLEAKMDAGDGDRGSNTETLSVTDMAARDKPPHY